MDKGQLVKLNKTDIPIFYSTEGLEPTTLIIIIVSSLVFIVIVVIIIICCTRKKTKEIQEEKGEKQVALEIKKESQKQKQFIIIDNPDKIADQNTRVYNLSALNEKSITERKLLGLSEPSHREIKDSFNLDNRENLMQSKINHQEQLKLEASFRNDLYKIDTQQDKIKELIQSKNNIGELSNDVLHYDGDNNDEKTSRDIVAENIHNYSDGNRADFYSEAADGIDEDIEEDINNQHENGGFNSNNNPSNYRNKMEINNHKNEITYSYKKPEKNINKQTSYSSVTKENTIYSSNVRKEIEQDMTPEEHSDFLEDEEEEEYEENDNYIENMKNNNHDFLDDMDENELPSEAKK